jgi:hypothetical protein
MKVDQACDNSICANHEKCARYQAYLNGDKNYKTFSGTADKGCRRFIEKEK